MSPTLRAALCFSPLIALALAPACGARSPLDDPSILPHSQGGGGSGSSSASHASSTSVSSSSASSSASSSSSGGPMNPVISQSPTSFIQSETSVAASAGGFVVVAWIDVDQMGSSSIGYTFSTDDGASFAPPTILSSPGGRVSSDPVVAVDAQGDFYLTWVGYMLNQTGTPNDMHIYVSKAAKGTTSFDMPIEASDPTDSTSLYDKPWITVTNTGTVIVTYERDQLPQTFSLVAARSLDGVSWQQSVIAIDPTGNVFRNLAFPCAPANGGRIWVTHLALDATTTTVQLVHSDDEGATWSPEVQVNQPDEPVSFDDPNCVAEQGDVWVSYGLTDDVPDPMGSMAKLFSIRLAHSGDGGQTFDTYVDAGDTAAAPFFMHPQIAREAGGAIDLVYYAGQEDEDDTGTYRRSRAAFPTAGFGPSVVVESPITYLRSRGDQRWLGDYTGVFWRAGELYTSYVTNASGAAQIAFGGAATP